MTEVAKAYGGALYELSAELGNSKEMLEEVSLLRENFIQNPKFSKLLTTPTLKKQDRLAILDDSFKSKIDQNVLNFLKILTENGTVSEFTNCVDEFRNRYNRDHNIEEAVVTTAVPMTEEQQQNLVEKLQTLTGKTIVLETKVDSSIIGGVHLEMDGVQLEGSIQNKLNVLRNKLLNA